MRARVLFPALTLFLIAAFALPPAHAEKGHPGSHGSGERWLDHLSKMRSELKLSDEQFNRIEAISRETEERNRPLVAQIEAVMGERPDREATKGMTKEQREAEHEKRKALWDRHPELQSVRDQIRENRKAAHEQIQSVLTAEQRQILERKHEEMKQRRGAKRGGEGGSRPADPNRM